ncbi:lysozyme [Allopontixanthobacter sp.]|uniref:lysozyme n=1 Tax=Allopontixanthobacter sp. TaxID=2906452 RepID=UPI002AB87E6B|nr:lysozyme [Allopontixanthobacter sp.]MDZ4307542.1 lysozyme [Allopontixanthobacter sp.]
MTRWVKPLPPPAPPPGSSGRDGIAAALVGLVGVTAAAALMVLVPEEESGRRVEAQVSERGDATLRHVSGRQYLETYIDIAGVPTACDGITRGIQPGQSFTEARCTALLIREIEIHARGALACAPSLARPGRDYQRVAAISLTFNIGVGGFCGSSARRLFEAGNISAACDRFLPWSKARVNGVLREVRGLTRRRHREREYCRTGLPGYTPASLPARLEKWK